MCKWDEPVLCCDGKHGKGQWTEMKRRFWLNVTKNYKVARDGKQRDSLHFHGGGSTRD